MSFYCPYCNKPIHTSNGAFPGHENTQPFLCPACNKQIDPQTVSGTATSAKLLYGDDLKIAILKNLKTLAPMPKVVLKAKKIMSDSRTSFKEVGNVIEADQAIAARVLQFANSAYYGMSGKIASIQDASVVLGVDALNNIINIAASSKLLGRILKGYNIKSGLLWKHSMAVAIASKLIAEKNNSKIKNDAFSAGLIHDVGMLVLDDEVRKRKNVFKKLLENTKNSYRYSEQSLFGFDHGEIAYEICNRWNIPESQSLAIKFHHTPSQSSDNLTAYIINIADFMAKLGGFGIDTSENGHKMDKHAMKRLELTKDELLKMVDDMVESAEKIFSTQFL